jgi:small subunit ribosomal protein S18
VVEYPPSKCEALSSNPVLQKKKKKKKKSILYGKYIDYKNVQLLSQFISPFPGYICGRHFTGLCGKKQKEITKVIKRVQIMGFLPVTYHNPMPQRS